MNVVGLWPTRIPHLYIEFLCVTIIKYKSQFLIKREASPRAVSQSKLLHLLVVSDFNKRVKSLRGGVVSSDRYAREHGIWVRPGQAYNKDLHFKQFISNPPRYRKVRQVLLAFDATECIGYNLRCCLQYLNQSFFQV